MKNLQCRFIAAVLALLALLPAGVGAAPARQAVDVELVIATDVSPSIDQTEARLQREGTAEAFLNREVIQAIRSGS